jgi:alpha-L-fucosidase
VKAARLLPGGRLGVVGTRTFVGLSPRGWKVAAVDVDPAGHAALAVDGNPATFWDTGWNNADKGPKSITIDMGAARRIAGLAYLPRQDGQVLGTVVNYRFETSVDGAQWQTAVAQGTFANIQNNPDWQTARFAPVDARYFRFTAINDVWHTGGASAAELTVIPADKD